MDDKFWFAGHVVMPAAWLMAALPDPTYHLVALAGVILGVVLLTLGHYAGRADDFLRAGMLSAWRVVVSSLARYLISRAVRAAAMIAAIITTRAARLADRRLPPPPAAPRHLPDPVLTPRFSPTPLARRA
jgi:hypothetical protein